MMYATIVGNIGNDAELKTLGSGKCVANFSVAAKNGRKDEAPAWVRCAIWGERASKLSQYLTKGKSVTAMGVLTRKEHEGKTYLELDVQEIALQGGASGDKPKATTSHATDDEIPF
jgi:single-strand DNA-binding protein